jgi:WD40 repeat protein
LPTTAAAWRFTPNSKSVLTLYWQGHLTRWRGAEFQDQEPVMTLGPHFSARISRDGRLAATAPLADRLIRVWDLQQRTLVRELKPSGGAAFALQFLAQGNNLLIAYVGSDLLETWDIPTGKRIVSWQAGTEGRAIAFSPDERSCLAIRLSGEASLRNMATGVETHPNLALRQARDAAFSPDGRIFAAASWLGRVNLWETASFRELGRLSSFLQGAYSVGFSPDGKRLVCGSDGREAIKLFEVPGGRELLTLEGEGWLFDDLAFSPDGDCLGAVNDKLVLHLWRAPSWEEIEAAEKRRADAP